MLSAQFHLSHHTPTHKMNCACLNVSTGQSDAGTKAVHHTGAVSHCCIVIVLERKQEPIFLLIIVSSCHSVWTGTAVRLFIRKKQGLMLP